MSVAKKKNGQIDLHVHSTFSDGTMTPTQLVDYAIKKNLSAIAITDHDTVDGIDEALSYAYFLSENIDTPVPKIIPGIELSTEYNNKDIHILGLYIDYNSKQFKEYLADFASSRDARNRQMCSLLCDFGIIISYEELIEANPNSVITRAHFGKMMYQKGYVKSIKEAFERYIGDNAPCFVPRTKVDPQKAIRLISNAGGFPVLAHPVLYKMGKEALETLIISLKKEGLKGIEALYSTYTKSDERNIRRLAEKYSLICTGGSDFHGSNKPDIDLGTGRGHLFIPESILNEIKKA